MNRITLNQLCYLLTISKDKAFSMIKASENDPHLAQKDEDGKHINHDFDVNRFKDKHGIDLPLILSDMYDNFTKSQESVEYVFKLMEAKLKPDKRGFLPLSISLPRTLVQLISHEQVSRLRQMVKDQLWDTLKETDKRPEIIVK